MALRKASSVMIWLGRKFSPTISTMRRPTPSAATFRRESLAGMPLVPEGIMPSGLEESVAMQVEAVPISLQVP